MATKYFKYTAAPFSGAKYGENSARCKADETPCAICGKGIKVQGDMANWPYAGIVIGGGDEWGDETSPEDGGHMGAFPVGSDCHRRFVVKG